MKRIFTFQQPEIIGPDHRPIDVDADLFERMKYDFSDINDNGFPPDWDPLSLYSKSFKSTLETSQNKIANLSIEHLHILDTNGNIVQESHGSYNSVSFDPNNIPARSVALHNHPEGTPPSLKDTISLLRWKFSLVRVITPLNVIYDLAPLNKNLGDMVLNFKSLDRQSWAVADECIRNGGLHISDLERQRRRRHALFMELARMKILCYRRFQWTNKAKSNERPE